MTNQLALHLPASLASGPFAIFAGAGISSIPPTKLPLWSKFNDALVNELANHATKLGEVWQPLVEELFRRMHNGELPTDYLSQIISNRIGARYFSVLKSLDGDQPNLAHRWLADLARARRLPFIITTNFDTLIERALQANHVPHQVVSQPEQFEAVRDRIVTDRDHCYLLKIHGSVLDSEGRLVDTLAQRLVGLPEPIAHTIAWVLDHFPIYFIGTSGSDLCAGDDYLQLRRGDIKRRTVFWVTLPESKVQPAVETLLDYYRDRGATAEVLRGKLPDDLPLLPSAQTFSVGLSLEMTATPTAMPAPHGFAQVLSEWGHALGAFECALLLADFSDHIGLPRLGIDALHRVLPSDSYEPVGAAAPLAVRLAELLAGTADRTSADRAIALLNQAERSQKLPVGDFEVQIARARIFAGSMRFDDAIRELSGPAATAAPEAQMLKAASLKAQCLQRLGRWRESLHEYEQVAADAARRGYPLFEGRCLLGSGELLGRIGEYAQAECRLADAEAAFRRVGATRDLADVPMAQARLSLRQRKYSIARAYAEEAAQKAGWASNLIAEARARMLWAESLYNADDRGLAQAIASRASQLAAESGDPQTQAECQNMEFRFQLDDKSRPGIHFVPQTPEEVGSTIPSSRFNFYMTKAHNAAYQNHFEKAFEWMALAENEVHQRASNEAVTQRMQLTVNFGRLLNRGNNPDSAYEYFTRFRTQINRYTPQDTVGTLQAIANQGDALRRAGRFKEAASRYDEGIAFAGRLTQVDPLTPQMKFYQASTLWRYGFVNQAISKLTSAASETEQAIEHPNELTRDYMVSMMSFLIRINNLISACYLELDRVNDAREYVGRIMKVAQILGGDEAPARAKIVAFVAAARYRIASGEQEDAFGLLKLAQEMAESPFSSERDDEGAAEILSLTAKNSLPVDLFNAQNMLRKAVEIWERLSVPLQAAHMLRQLSGYLFKGGDSARAHEALLQAEIYFTRLDNQFGLGLCKLMRARWALYAGSTSKAKALADEALGLFPEKGQRDAVVAAAISFDPGGSISMREPTSEQFPQLVAEFRGSARLVRLYRGDIRHAAGRYADPYDGILFFRPMKMHQLLGPTKSAFRLRHPNRDVGVVLGEIVTLCAAKQAQTVAIMPFGGPDNRAILNWINEVGPPRKLDIYYIDVDDYRDIVGDRTV